MAKHGCVNGSLGGVNYSSPVPIIGLYIAGGSLLCMAIMLYDIIAGFRAMKRWLPCKYFTLNSVTLTLLGIATKLAVDLTTAMPSPQDQLSKLSATTLICIAMGFLMPSIGNTNESECLTNMVALTIFVITVIVNICIQLSTRVIVLFIVEHVLIIVFMLLLLGMLWYCSWDSNSRKKNPIENTKLMLHNLQEASMFRRISISYEDTFVTNPQLVTCRHPNNYSTGGICLFCSAILTQAVVRSLILKRVHFCSGDSDYSWSMWVIVATQLLTVVVGCFGTSFRWLTMVKHTNFNLITESREDDDLEVIDRHPLLGTVSIFNKGRKLLVYICFLTLLMVQLLFKFPLLLLQFVFDYFGHKKEPEDLTHGELGQWMERKSVEDMNRWIQVCTSKPWIHVYQLLSKTSPSEPQPPIHIVDPTGEEMFPLTVSCLSIVLLVRFSEVLLPEVLHGSLVLALTEVDEVLRFIAKTVLSPKDIDDKTLLFSKAVWKGPGFHCYLPEIFSQIPESDQQPQTDIDRANLILQSLSPIVSRGQDHVSYTIRMILPLFKHHGSFITIDDLYNFIRQVFVDMLHAVLAQFPNAIFHSLHESPDEEFEERVKVAMRFFCKVECLDGHIQWVYPSNWDTHRFLSPEDRFGDSGTETTSDDLGTASDSASESDDFGPAIGDVSNVVDNSGGVIINIP